MFRFSLTSLFGYLLNNIGDPYVDPLSTNHSKVMEREVISFFADLFNAPKDDRWGYVTNGGSEGNLYALYIARTVFPDGVVYYSQAAHYSIPKNIHLLGMKSAVVAATETGEMQYSDLRHKLCEYPEQTPIIIANIGTTMTEAKDDVAAIKQLLQDEGITESYIHSDAALAGVYAALLEPHHPFDFADGADSISISGHKFIGSPMACGVVITRRTYRDALARSGAYVGSPDTTITGSRNGHTPLFLWHAIQRFGIDGFRERILRGLEQAAYLERELRKAKWQAWRNPNAITVVLRTPPLNIVHKWQLAAHEGWSHVICMPGITQEQLDAFIGDMRKVPKLKPTPVVSE